MLEYLADVLEFDEFFAFVLEAEVFEDGHGGIFDDEGAQLGEVVL